MAGNLKTALLVAEVDTTTTQGRQSAVVAMEQAKKDTRIAFEKITKEL